MTTPQFVAAVLVACFGSAFAKTASAQTGTLPDDTRRIEKTFDARLADAQRISLQPSLPAIDTAVVPQRYEVIPVETDVAYDAPKIRPLAVKTEPAGDTYKGFARTGAGYPGAWLGDVGYVTTNETLGGNIDLHTYGINGLENDNQRYAEVNGNGGLTYYLPNNLAVSGGVSYDRKNYRYYGYPAAVGDTTGTDSLPDDRLRQHFANFGMRAGIRNIEKGNSGIDYYATIEADFLRDNFASREDRIQLIAGGRRSISNIWWAAAEFDADLTTFEAEEEQKINNYAFRPTVGAHFDKLGVRLGVEVANADDEFRFFPAIEANYQLGGGITAIAGADGGLIKNDYARLTQYLPFLVVNPELRNTERYRGYVGLRGRARGVDYAATASYARENNIALFAQDAENVYQFRPQYDTAGVVGLNLELSAPLAARLSGQLTFDTRFYNLKTASEPFGLPTIDISGHFSYVVLPEKFTARAHVGFQNGIPYPTLAADGGGSEGDISRGEVLADLSLSGDYRISTRFGAFAQVNNLLNNRREQFLNYPSVGVNLLVGVTARF